MNDMPPMPEAGELARAAWIRAQKSNSGGCVEVAHLDNWVVVRNSRDPSGPKQFYTVHEWECFLDGARKGEFDR